MRIRPSLRLRSFRLRIALLSVVVSGVVLAVFVSLTFAALHRISMQRIDKDIKEFTHKHLVQPPGPRHWERVGDSLRFFLEDEDENTFILLVKDREGATLYVSPNWPWDLSTDEFPRPDGWGQYPNNPLPPRPPPRPRPPPEPNSNYRENREDTNELARNRPPGPPGGPPPNSTPLKTPEFFTRDAGGNKWRIGMTGNPDLTIVLGLNLRRLNSEIAQVRHALFAILPISLLFVAAGAWWVSQRALKPIEAVTKTIKQVKAKGLDQRISNQDEDREFSELITLFNDMMDWLEKTFHQAIRFSADASHELKTPLTVLQAQLEQAVHETEPGSDEQRRYVAFGRELQRLKSITQKLLLLSRIDAGELKLNLRPLNLSELVEGVVEDTEVLAPALKVESELAPDLWVMADADLMKQVVQNLAANAVKYNHKGGVVRFGLRASGPLIQLMTENSGRGIPTEDRDKVFTRFFRGDKARSRRVSGAGLGLSLAREIVRAHHGELVLDHSSGEITTFLLTLPRASS